MVFADRLPVTQQRFFSHSVGYLIQSIISCVLISYHHSCQFLVLFLEPLESFFRKSLHILTCTSTNSFSFPSFISIFNYFELTDVGERDRSRAILQCLCIQLFPHCLLKRLSFLPVCF